MASKFRKFRYALAPLGAGLLFGCSGDRLPQTAATIALKECRVPGVETALKCATHEVFENREAKSGRKIGLNVVVYPASARIKEPDPIFIFAGGPGQAATDVIASVTPQLSGLTTKRDVVFIDQRGTGKSNLLNCKFPSDDAADMASAETRRAVTLKVVTECRDTLAQRADLTQYGSTTAMADYDEVRAGLGYDKINLWGGSYGTRTAQEYLRRYPDRVRTVVLDGVASPSMALPATFARDAGAALESAFKACETNPKCQQAYPDFRGGFAALLGRLDKQPIKIAIRDPLTNLTREITVSRQMVATQVFTLLYVPQFVAVLPEAIKQASVGNYAPLFAASGGFMDFAEDKIAFGMRLSVSCSEDVSRIDAAARDEAAKVQPFQTMFIREFSTACENWPKGKVAADFHSPVKSDKPVLILSGGIDPVTPPIFGDEVKKTFSNSVHLVAPNIGHGVSQHGCAPKMIKQFIEKASVEGIDGECLKRLPRPSYFQAMVEKPKDASSSEKSGAKP
ncbi:MAG: alpha/beta fold hydrolase [Burkholderiales bacterium]|jgi:pimeloyl-ACP methyl ester carboxylesterase